jgi:hypothetical protein
MQLFYLFVLPRYYVVQVQCTFCILVKSMIRRSIDRVRYGECIAYVKKRDVRDFIFNHREFKCITVRERFEGINIIDISHEK